MSGKAWTLERMQRLTKEEVEQLSRGEIKELVFAHLESLSDRQAVSWLCGTLLAQERAQQWDEDRWDVALTRVAGRPVGEEHGDA